MGKVMVSIVCSTYNHENYIAEAIDSFLMQKTNFKFEILIHDDASTDRTTDIIKEYERKYPELVKPIYQTENQYSKGIKVGKFNRERAKGKYVAICEGDDYWTDPYKLQKQVEYMNAHPECCMCVHAAYKVDANNQKLKKYVRPNIGNKIYTVEEIIKGGGGLFATNSIIYPRKICIDKVPFYKDAPVGDYPTVIYLALQGSVYYIDEFMSVYRKGVRGSWSVRINENTKKRVEHKKLIEKMLNKIDQYTNYNYTDVIQDMIIKNQFEVKLIQKQFKDLKTGKYKKIYDSLSNKEKIKINIKQYFPNIEKVIKIVRGKYYEK
ncbi:MAG: glycosyltransferase family 2 protein [bacterium]